MDQVHPFPCTRRQMDLLRFIAGYTEARGCAPDLREMANAIGLATKGGVVRLLTGLEQRGHVARGRYRERSTVVLSNPPLARAPDGAPLHFIPVELLGCHGGSDA